MDIWYNFNKVLKPLYGRGLGQVPGVEKVYRFIYHLLPKDSILKMHGMEWEVGKDADISAAALALRSWEEYEMNLFLSAIKPGMTVVDVGASFGFYTCLAAGTVGPSGKVYAFEPFMPTYNLLLRNIERNGLKNVLPSSEAISNKIGIMDTYVNRSEAGIIAGPQVTPSGIVPIQVPCISLDNVLTSPLDVVKIDAEGYDLHVVQGMERLIEENKNLVLLIEVGPKWLEYAGSSMELLLGTLERSFVLYLVKEREETLELVDSEYSNVRKECSGLVGTANLYCRRK